jgi:uncharacterized protein YdhG (YjbR/CyaY superfamily)
MMNAKPANVDDYLAGVPEEARGTLEEVRRMIRAAAPEAVEGMGYGMPGYKYRGRPLAYFAAAKNHCGLYGLPAEIEAFREELKAYDVSKGTIRFPPGDPLPEHLVRGLVKARMTAIEAAEEARKGKRRSG